MKPFPWSLSLFAALIASATSAVAQQASELKIGGQIKLGLDHVVSKSDSRPALSASRMSNNTSFWYVDGKEQLSGDLQAYFHMEWDFSAATGASGAGRNFYLGLNHKKWGKLQLGRQSVYFSHHWFLADSHGSFDAAPNAANSLNVLGSINGAHFAGGFLNNTIRYEAPKVGGFAGMLSYSFDGQPRSSWGNGTVYINPTYTQGPFKLGLYHMQRKLQTNAANPGFGALDQTANRLAAAYSANGLRVGLVIDRNKVKNSSTGDSEYRTAYAIPVNYVFGQHMLSGTWGQALNTHHNGTTVRDSGVKMLSLSYQYALSKRTYFALSAVELRNQKNGRYGFWLGGLSGMQLPLADAGGSNRMLYAGIKHTF